MEKSTTFQDFLKQELLEKQPNMVLAYMIFNRMLFPNFPDSVYADPELRGEPPKGTSPKAVVANSCVKLCQRLTNVFEKGCTNISCRSLLLGTN